MAIASPQDDPGAHSYPDRDMTALDSRSAVEAFGDWHDSQESCELTPEGRYLRPLPASPTTSGVQFRFEVDLDRCSGCKACVSACVSLNGLDPGETWRSVGLLIGGGGTEPVWQQHVTTACHHCLEPACLAGCPVDAYEKDPVTGIVSHLDDQCIGCRYCMLTCPYEVPSYNSRLGVVRKCDMCTDRLAVGEAPACVQGCPTDAIAIGLVESDELAASIAADPSQRLVSTAPRSALTTPTTVYLTSRQTPTSVSAVDDHRVVPASNHPPLVAMLVLTQVSVGAVVVGQMVALATDWLGPAGRLGAGPALAAWLMTSIAILASVLHLGRPAMAWRALLGIGHSWLSREILAFGIYAVVGGVAALAAVGVLPRGMESGAGVATALVGLVGVVCSAQLYAVTGRAFWRLDRTLARFSVTMGACGSAVLTVAVSIASGLGSTDLDAHHVRAVSAVVVVTATALGLVAARSFQVRHSMGSGELSRSVSLLRGPLRPQCAGASVMAITVVVAAGASLHFDAASRVSLVLWTLVLVLSIAGSWLERRLFFVAVAPDRMPGGLL